MAKKKRGFFNIIFNIDEFKSTFKLTKDEYSNIKKNKSKNSVKESFEESIKRQNISEEDLHNKKVMFRKMSIVSYFSLLIVFIISATFIQFDILKTILVTVLSFYLFLNGLRFSMHIKQIEKRELNILKKFLKTPSWWFPIKKIKVISNERSTTK
tara:strand:+ start:12372 stop:12836 length:465 start_codon:yes stop_codon:yes gene_type:complete